MSTHVELRIDDIDGIGIDTSQGSYGIKLRMSVEQKHLAGNVAALLNAQLKVKGWDETLRKVFTELFTEHNHLRLAAEASLQAIIADEAEQQERDAEEFERQQAIKQGPALTED